MKLTTSREKTFEVDWIDGPTSADGRVWLQIPDERRLPEIAADFDGLEWMEKETAHGGTVRYEGWSLLSMIKREAEGVAQLAFLKEGAVNV